MSQPDLATLTLKIRRLEEWSEANGPPPAPTLVSHFADHPSARVTVDPASNAGAASLNNNRITLWGGRGLLPSELDDMAGLFEAQGIRRFFVWLHPGPDLGLVREWLAARGAVEVPWTRYPMLVYRGGPPPRWDGNLEVREVTRRDIEATGITDEATPGGYLATIGLPGFHHFAAFEAGRLIATAGLTHADDVGFLNGAKTAEPFRRRGAQTALIAARVHAALGLGCRLIVSHTLTMLPSSFANLRRAGFEVAYERQVYECMQHEAPSAGLVTGANSGDSR